MSSYAHMADWHVSQDGEVNHVVAVRIFASNAGFEASVNDLNPRLRRYWPELGIWTFDISLRAHIRYVLESYFVLCPRCGGNDVEHCRVWRNMRRRAQEEGVHHEWDEVFEDYETSDPVEDDDGAVPHETYDAQFAEEVRKRVRQQAEEAKRERARRRAQRTRKRNDRGRRRTQARERSYYPPPPPPPPHSEKTYKCPCGFFAEVIGIHIHPDCPKTREQWRTQQSSGYYEPPPPPPPPPRAQRHLMDAQTAASLLGISLVHSIADVQSAWKRKARECHPDLGGSHEKMVEVNLARDVLLARLGA
jgi:hypothetical protein